MPSTSQVTAVFVEVVVVLVVPVELTKLTVALNCTVVLIGALAVVGVIIIEVTVPGALLLPPHADKPNMLPIARANTKMAGILCCMTSFPDIFGRTVARAETHLT